MKKLFCQHLLVTLPIDIKEVLLILRILHEQNHLLKINMHVGELMFEAVGNWDDSRSGEEAWIAFLPAEQPQLSICIAQFALVCNHKLRTRPAHLKTQE